MKKPVFFASRGIYGRKWVLFCSYYRSFIYDVPKKYFKVQTTFISSSVPGQ